MYQREALGHSDFKIDFSARSPCISGIAENFIFRNVALKSTKIVPTAKGELKAGGRLGSYDQSFRYDGQLEIIDNLGKIAITTVQLTATNGFIFTTDDGDLAGYGLLITEFISDVPAFSGTDMNAIAIGQVTEQQ